MRARPRGRKLRSLRFSAVVVCRGSEESAKVRESLDALGKASHLPCDKVVVFASAPETEDPALAVPGLRVVTLRDDESALAAVLNRAAAQAVGEFLLFMPAGFRLRRGWEKRYLALLTAGPCLLGRRWLCLHRGRKAELEGETPDAFLDWQGMAVPHSLFERLGGLDPQFEDEGFAIDLCLRARERKVALQLVGGEVAPRLPVSGATSPTRWKQSESSMAFERDLLRLHAKYPHRLEIPEHLGAWDVGRGAREAAQDRKESRAEATRAVPPLPSWVRSPYRQRPVRDGERILIHRDIGLGDVLLSLTAAQAFKDQNPNCRITFSTNGRYLALPAHSPAVDEALTPNQVRAGSFDREVDFEGREKFDFVGGEGRKERLDLIAEIVGYRPKVRHALYVVRPEERAALGECLRRSGVGERSEKIGVVLSAASPFRSRSPEASSELVRGLLEDRPRAHVLLLDNDEGYLRRMDLPRSSRLTNLCGNLDLPQLAALLEQLDLLITPDTGPMHLAAAFETPQIVFFTEIHPQARVSHYLNVVARARGELCLDWPCGYGGHCRTNQQCINSITYGDLKRDVERLLKVSFERKALRDRQVAEDLTRRSFVTNVRRVLLERYGGLGDILFALTVAGCLKRLNPEVEIDFVTSQEHAEWVSWFPFLNEVTTRRPGKYYGLRVNLQAIETMDGVDRVEVMAAKLGLLTRPGEQSPYSEELGCLAHMLEVPHALKCDLQGRVEAETRRTGSDADLGLLALAPFCVNRKPDRSWPVEELEGFLALATPHYRVLLLDGSRVIETADRPNLLRFDGRTSVAEAIAAVGLCERFVGVDSGLLYAALASGVPAVGLFSHIEPLSRLARGRNYIALRPTGLDCIPCGDFDGDLPCVGTERHLACVKALRPSVVWRALREVPEGEGQVWTTPVARGQVHRPPKARPRLTFVVPWLQPAGGERHLHYLCEGLHGEYDVHLGVTDPELSHSVEALFSRWPVLNLDGDRRTRARRLAAHLDEVRPKVVVFYNNCLTLDALERSSHRPEKLLALIHTQFEHEADLTSHPMSYLVDRFVCVSQTVREVLRSRTPVDPTRMVVIPNGVEVEGFEGAPHLRGELGYTNDDFVIGNVGRIGEGKNLTLILEAAALLPGRLKVLFVGWGNQADLCRTRALELNLGERFQIVGPTPKVAPYFRSLDAFILPTDIEGSVPYALMEAMAAAVPTLCTRVSDVPKLFQEGESILFIEKTPESIAAKVGLLIESPALRESVAEGAKAVLAQQLSADRMVDHYLSLLED